MPSQRSIVVNLLVVLGVTTGMVLLTPSAALACQCVTSSVADQVDRADTIVGGTVEWTSTTGNERTYGLRIDEVYKGVAGMREKVLTADASASCGLGELATEQRYLLFLQGRHPGRLTVNSCSGSGAYTSDLVLAVQAETDGPFEPLPSMGGEPPVADGVDPIRVVGIGAFVVAAGVGAFAMARSRRRNNPASG